MDTAKRGIDYYNDACELINSNSNDFKTIVSLLEKGVELDCPEAMNNLAFLYLEGEGVEKNGTLAAYYFSVAANEHNYQSAQTSLGYCYLNGIGVQTSIKKAMQLFKKASQQGEPNSLINIEYINNTFTLNDDYSLKKSSFKRSGWATLICVIALVVSLIMTMWSFWAIGYTEGINKLIGVLACVSLVNLVGAILVISKNRLAFKLLIINMILGLLFLLTFSFWALSNGAISNVDSQVMLILGGGVFSISLILFMALFIKNYHKISFISALLEDHPAIKMLYELGSTKEFGTNSIKTKKLKSITKWYYYIISAAIVALSIYMAIYIKFNFSLSGSPFSSGITLFFFFASIPFMIFQPSFTQKTFHVFQDSLGNEKGRKASDDMGDTVMDMIMPIIGKFVIVPMIIALICYGIIYLILEVVSFLLPFLFAALALFLLKYVKKSFDKILYRKARAKLLPLATMFYFSLYMVVFGAICILSMSNASVIVGDRFVENTQEILKTDFGDKITLKDGQKAEYVKVGEKAEDFYHFYAVFFSDENRQKERIESPIALFRYDYYDNNGAVREVIKDASLEDWDFIAKINPWDTDIFDVKSSPDKVIVIAIDEPYCIHKEYTFVLNQSGQWFLKEVYSKEPEPWTGE